MDVATSLVFSQSIIQRGSGVIIFCVAMSIVLVSVIIYSIICQSMTVCMHVPCMVYIQGTTIGTCHHIRNNSLIALAAN